MATCSLRACPELGETSWPDTGHRSLRQILRIETSAGCAFTICERGLEIKNACRRRVYAGAMYEVIYWRGAGRTLKGVPSAYDAKEASSPVAWND
jgi:hypothetical protein